MDVSETTPPPPWLARLAPGRWLGVSPNSEDVGVRSGPESLTVTPEVRRMLGILKIEMSRREIMNALALRDEEHFREHHQQPAMAAGLIE
jgi:hypothetical protein